MLYLAPASPRRTRATARRRLRSSRVLLSTTYRGFVNMDIVHGCRAEQTNHEATFFCSKVTVKYILEDKSGCIHSYFYFAPSIPDTDGGAESGIVLSTARHVLVCAGAGTFRKVRCRRPAPGCSWPLLATASCLLSVSPWPVVSWAQLRARPTQA